MARTTYVALLRGINVGGKNLVPMAALREAFEAGGYGSVRTYMQSTAEAESARAVSWSARSEVVPTTRTA